MKFANVDRDQLLALKPEVQQKYEDFKAKNLKLDLTRGKPSSEQLDFSIDLLSLPGENFYTADGTDTRNYGGLIGIPEIRELWADLLGLNPKSIVCGDASSLNMAFDLISWAYAFGTNDSAQPWAADAAEAAANGDKLKWICPVPGYDRHHTITDHFGFEMLTVDLLEDGPDMAQVRELAKDPLVKGMWAVPMFSNPTGTVYSEEVCRELASLETGAPDFRIVWDNAYAVHTLTDDFAPIYNVLEFAESAGHPNRFWFMSSTSKITLAGAGVAFFASSDANLNWWKTHATVRGIGPNKVNQLAHSQFFGDADGVRAIMRKHAGSLAPKFRRVVEILEDRLGGLGVAEWTDPAGGYFISVNLLEGTASRTVELAKEAGVALTAAGSTYPNLEDPKDSNLRLAPSMPPLEQVELAMDGFATCALLAAIEAAEADTGAGEGA